MNQKEQDRREFWKQQMDDGYDFMEAVKRYPVEECSEKCVSLQDAADDAQVEMIFSDSDILPGTERQFYLRTGLIPHFLAATKINTAVHDLGCSVCDVWNRQLQYHH